jgi:hypothetical protein
LVAWLRQVAGGGEGEPGRPGLVTPNMDQAEPQISIKIAPGEEIPGNR